MAIEPDPEAADHLKKLNKFEVVEASLGEGPDSGQFPLVTLNKVSEHLADPIGFLRLVLPTMAPSGSVLYVEEPDLLSIESLPSTDNILGSLHNHLYSPTALVAVLREVGLEVLQVSRVADPSGKMSVHAFASLRCAAHLLDCERLPASAMAKFFRLAGSPYGAVADRLFA